MKCSNCQVQLQDGDMAIVIPFTRIVVQGETVTQTEIQEIFCVPCGTDEE